MHCLMFCGYSAAQKWMLDGNTGEQRRDAGVGNLLYWIAEIILKTYN